MDMQRGAVISYLDMCREEGVNLQRGMNYRLHNSYSIILMSLRRGAPYADRVEEDGQVLIYEGHDEPRRNGIKNPKAVDQPMQYPGGRLTQNGLFFEAASQLKMGQRTAERVKVYEKIQNGIWAYNDFFDLIDAWRERANGRQVFKFKLRLIEDYDDHRLAASEPQQLEHDRIIPTSVKLAVWKRDKGACVKCASQNNLHFDHVIPFSLGGASIVAENIQLLCARHNLQKHDRIE